MYVIINVDDLGLHPAVQRAVDKGSDLNVITSASILANGNYLNDIRLLSNKVGLGVHLNILRGKSMLPAHDIPSLVNLKGQFILKYSKLFQRYMSKQLSLSEIEMEWSKQIEYLLGFGIKITHIDSEKHIHCWPGLMPVAQQLAKYYNIKWVRRVRELNPWYQLDIGGIRSKLLTHWSKYYKTVDFPLFPDIVWGIADTGKNLLLKRFEKYIKDNLHYKIIEIVCHPGISHKNDPPIPDEFGYLQVPYSWDTEFQLLTSQNWTDFFRDNNMHTVHYGMI